MSGVDPNGVATWQQDTPRRPAQDDIVNGVKVNRTPTVDPRNPAAEEFMQMAEQLVALGAMIPLLRVSISWSGASDPVLVGFQCVRTDILTSDIQITKNGTGDVTISLLATKIPALTCQPHGLTLNEIGVGGVFPPMAIAYSSGGRVGVRVQTVNDHGTLSGIPFTVDIS